MNHKNMRTYALIHLQLAFVICTLTCTAAFAQSRPEGMQNETDAGQRENDSDPNANKIIQKQFHLEKARPSELGEILEPLLSEQGYTDPNDEAKTLLIADNAETLERLEPVVERFDSGVSPSSSVLFEVPHGDPREIVELINAILKQTANANSPSSAISWRSGRITGSGREAPATSEPQSLSELEDKEQIVEKFFYLEHSSPAQIAKIIEPMLSSEGYISVEENAGTILVIDKARILLQIDGIIRKLDVRPEARNYQQIFQLKYMNPKRAAEVVDKTIELGAGDVSEETVIIPFAEKKWLIVGTETSETMKLIAELIENIDFQLTNEGTSDIRAFSVTRAAELEEIIKPLLGSNGHAIAIEQAQTLVTTDTRENLTHFEKLLKVLDSVLFKSGEPRVEVNLQNAGIEKIIEALIKWTGKAVIPAREAMNLTVNVRVARRLPRSSAVNLIKHAVNSKGFIIEETPNLILIKPVKNESESGPQANPGDDLNDNGTDSDDNSQSLQSSERRASGRMSLGGFAGGTRAGTQNRAPSAMGSGKKLILPLARNIVQGVKDFFRGEPAPEYETIAIMYADVNQSAKNIKTIVNSRGSEFTRNIAIQPLVQSRQLLVFGKKQYRDMVRKLVAEIDVPNNQLQRKTFRLRYAKPEDVKAGLDELFDSKHATETTNGRTVYTSTIVGTLSPVDVAVTAYKPLGQIVVLAPEETVKEITKLIEEWDSPASLACSENR